MSDERTTKEEYRLTLKGPGLAVDKIIDSQTAGAIAQMTFSGVGTDMANVGQGAKTPQPTLAPSMQRMSLREYLQTNVPDRGIHTKILAVARYMRDFESQSDFNREDVRSRFRSAGEPQPANFHRDFQKAVRAGWIAEDHRNRGRYYVTRTGDEAIDSRQGLVPAASFTRAARKTRRLAASDNVEQ
jgi:hypothetical protein